MSSLESMIKKLSPLGVYNLSENTMVYAELAAFSIGLDMLRENLDTLLKENFVATAEDFGLKNTERLLGNVRDDLMLSERREMLKERLSLNVADFTLAGFEKMLKILGTLGVIEEYPKTQRIVLNLAGEEYSEAEREWIVSQAKALLPAHLVSDIVFAGFDWKRSDLLANTFAEIESKGLVWSEIDYLV